MSSSRVGTTNCHRNRPVCSSKHIKTPRSPWCLGARGWPLLVPMYTRPPAITGEEWVSVPNSADHLMFLPVAGSKAAGKLRSLDTMLRDPARPHCGESAERPGERLKKKQGGKISRGLACIGLSKTPTGTSKKGFINRKRG